MKIPKYIEKLIDKRARLAVFLNQADFKLADWLEKNEVDVEDYDIYGGCEIYVNPWESANRIKQAIKDKVVKINRQLRKERRSCAHIKT